MRYADREVPVGGEGRRDDDAVTLQAARKVGELLLEMDELEDTLRALEDFPEIRPSRSGESRGEVVRVLEHRIAQRRAKIEALERMGAVDYDEIDRAMRISEAMG